MSDDKSYSFVKCNWYFFCMDTSQGFQIQKISSAITYKSVMTVVEFHSVAGEIQYIFTSK